MTKNVGNAINIIDIYINNYVKSFRRFISDKYIVSISSLMSFITESDDSLSYLLHQLRKNGFEVTILKGQETIDEIQVEYNIEGDVKNVILEYRIENIISTIYLSSKSGISIVGILVMQIISMIICKSKTMYKAIILDLDETLWNGTLVEEGIDSIRRNFLSDKGLPFITFMNFIKVIAQELGIFVAICTRNDIEVVKSAIEKLNENEFPLKGQIDCIVANYNDKSGNIKAIAQKLSILTNACVFIDDNQLIRDEVRHNLPEVFVPDWANHDELLILLMTCCVFDRFELSLRARNRKRLYEVLQQERSQSYRPQLFVKTSDDICSIEALRLYAKSNQFKFVDRKDFNLHCKSIIFEIYRDNGENLGICSAITYIEGEQGIKVLNWAISCRYFEIGLEEYILMYISSLSDTHHIIFDFKDTGMNGKVLALIDKYNSYFIKNANENNVNFIANVHAIRNLQLNTNLKEYCNV